MYFFECWNCAQLFMLLLDSHHPNTLFLGNVLVSNNPSVYVPVITKLPKFYIGNKALVSHANRSISKKLYLIIF